MTNRAPFKHKQGRPGRTPGKKTSGAPNWRRGYEGAILQLCARAPKLMNYCPPPVCDLLDTPPCNRPRRYVIMTVMSQSTSVWKLHFLRKISDSCAIKVLNIRISPWFSGFKEGTSASNISCKFQLHSLQIVSFKMATKIFQSDNHSLHPNCNCFLQPHLQRYPWNFLSKWPQRMSLKLRKCPRSFSFAFLCCRKKVGGGNLSAFGRQGLTEKLFFSFATCNLCLDEKLAMACNKNRPNLQNN